MDLRVYTKFIVGILMALYNIANQAWGVTIEGIDETTMTTVVNTVFAVLIYALPNKKA